MAVAVDVPSRRSVVLGLQDSVEAMSGKRILVVDDEPFVGECIRMVLDLDQHVIEFVTDPLEALQRYRPGKYDLVLTDSRMGTMSGLQLAEKIKSISSNQRVMLLTGIPPSDTTPAIDWVMLKPFSHDELRRAVCRLTE